MTDQNTESAQERLELARTRELTLRRRLRTANDNVTRLERVAPLSRRALQVAKAERDKLALMHTTLQRSIDRMAQDLRRRVRR